jgi:AcrR family transcriptional regulator
MTDEKRPYRKKRRAELEEQTRLRITESAVELHGTLGPSRTSMSAIAERAGVRRSTLYRHFPDEVAVFQACSAHWAAAHPPPDLGAWAAIEDPDERLATALGELYAYYRSGESMLANLHRDEALMPTVQ